MAQTKEGAIKVAAARAGLTPEAYKAQVAAGLKRCTVCKEWRPVASFGKDATRSDGLAAKCLGHRRVAVRVNTKGRPSAFKGRHHSEEARIAMSQAAKARPSNRIGRRHSVESRRLISQQTRLNTPRGAACHSYKDGKLAERMGQRHSAELKRWRFDVYSRDAFTCQDCGDSKGGNLNAHHIKPFADFPELRFELSNGVTLCESCHKKRHAK